MADIDIVPKKGSSVWLWIVLVVVALALLFWYMSARNPAPSVQLHERVPAGVGALDTGGPLAA